ncbi:hypothetical protein BU24DRAFT_450684 [Aaosphaeria arxii CBS 175.79]|uniref:RING-CH-type domain-containing protein n=1 Tax=Aaosphaeria arxii CBS 175.79 TaxID=1450172 RepID=A0A6A5XSD1_9PLEO|nr:uncharacterized protein BU24DRAFT_450684 [Aaosphaeria arxii CBS 175.79]KAF2016082.1 hypothetical protein BU24DRAFT_450684 [Aaosphaeria arxii CBS 175.79]
MASLPPRAVSQRRPSPRDDSASLQQQTPARTGSSSTTSEDSQTVLLNSPSSSSRSAHNTDLEFSRISHPHTTDEPPQPITEPRRCWICFSDETEDDENTSEWRSPCPCVLEAHEKCLLDWIADMEAPNSRRRAGSHQSKILCPQCKSEIRLERPSSLILSGVRAIEMATSLFLLPGTLLTVGSAAYSTLALVGRAHVYQIFGTQDALQILGPLYEAPDIHNNSLGARFLIELRDHWRLHLGLPMIPTALMLSRSTFADSFLPFLPLVFFVGNGGSRDELLQVSWPPSAAFTMALLPYVRGMYNTYYEMVWLPRERRWLKEIQPRADADVGNDINAEVDGGDEDGNVVEEAIELEVDLGIFGDWNNGGAADNNGADENPPVPVARGPGNPPEVAPVGDMDADEAPPVEADNAAPAPNVPQAVPQAQPAVPLEQRVRRERNIAFSATSFAQTILGAVVFPSIAAAVGEALKLALPKSMVNPPSTGKPTGFLQTKWGRSIVGGCLFVGIKDALMLYVRWKMAQNHRMRRVLDYDRSRTKGRNK